MLGLLILIFWLISSNFQNHLFYKPLFDRLILKHHSPQLVQLKGTEKVFFEYAQTIFKTIKLLDKYIPYFPSQLKLYFWHFPCFSTLFLFPLFILISYLILFLPCQSFFIILYILILFPANHFSQKGKDLFIKRTKLNLQTPWSKEFIWVWGNNIDNNYQKFTYSWDQKKPQPGKLKVSCLGHYQLFINNNLIGYGPNFAVLPKVYFHEIKLDDYIKKGDNEIEVICRYDSKIVHEHPFYSRPGLLIGGQIKNGLLTRNLADERFWQVSDALIKPNLEISADAAPSEEVNLVNEVKKHPVAKLNLDYQLKKNPLQKIKYQKINYEERKKNIIDLNKFMVVYAEFKFETNNNCQLKLYWGDEIKNSKVIPYFNQIDTLNLPQGESECSQFGRRGARYVQIVSEEDCLKNIEINFLRPLGQVDFPNQEVNNQEDKRIISLINNSLKNNIQGHFEDCPVRERAMYLGDAYAIIQCLPNTKKNNQYIKTMLQQFAESQSNSGIIPSMVPSGKEQFIPGYSLQWIIWLDQYYQKSNDLEFLRKMKPYWEKVIQWANSNQSRDGFIFSKNGQDWWNFISWDNIDHSLKYSTGLQIWYYQALVSSHHISSALDIENNYLKKADKIKTNLNKYALSADCFSDSFNLNHTKRGTVSINGLAGKYGVFENKKQSEICFNSFYSDQIYPNSAYALDWVVDWAGNLGKKEISKDLARNYFSEMIESGATSSFEIYNYYTGEIKGSHSHAWGCGAVEPLFNL